MYSAQKVSVRLSGEDCESKEISEAKRGMMVAINLIVISGFDTHRKSFFLKFNDSRYGLKFDKT